MPTAIVVKRLGKGSTSKAAVSTNTTGRPAVDKQSTKRAAVRTDLRTDVRTDVRTNTDGHRPVVTFTPGTPLDWDVTHATLFRRGRKAIRRSRAG